MGVLSVAPGPCQRPVRDGGNRCRRVARTGASAGGPVLAVRMSDRMKARSTVRAFRKFASRSYINSPSTGGRVPAVHPPARGFVTPANLAASPAFCTPTGDSARETRQLAWPPRRSNRFFVPRNCGGGGGGDDDLCSPARSVSRRRVPRAEILNVFSQWPSTGLEVTYEKCDGLLKNYTPFRTRVKSLFKDSCHLSGDSFLDQSPTD